MATKRLGSTARHRHSAIGVTIEARSTTTRLERIEVQVGRTGVLTPVAVLRPVQIGGVTVTRATLHNWHDLARRQIRLGDIVEVARAGVIPEIVARVVPSHRAAARLRPPLTCPSCHARVVHRGPFLVCPNTIGCPAQRVGAIAHFASRDAFDIDGLGPKTIELLVQHGLVQTVADLFLITDDDLRAMPRFGPIAATRLAGRIEAARRVSLARFLFALGIPDVGTATARRLAERFGTFAAIRRAAASRLVASSAVGASTAHHIVEFFKQPSSHANVEALLRRVTILPQRRHRAV